MIALDFIATSTSSILANFVTHPFETIKTRQVVTNSSFTDVVRRTMQSSDGIASFYRGFSASIARAIISGGGRQTIYYGLKRVALSHQKSNNDSIALRVAIGMVSGILAAGLAAPVDMARTRQQAAAAGSANNVSMTRILSESYQQGGLRGLWRGSSAVFLRQAILNGSQLATYDRAKAFVSSRVQQLPADSYSTMFLSSAISGLVTTMAIAPVETIKTKLQFNKGQRMTLLEASRLQLKTDGLRSFWRGSFALYVKLAPHTVIVLILTDKFREILNIPMIL